VADVADVANADMCVSVTHIR